uniref:Putative secreted protein n=1 Tax=Anopheles triannulatus TaxID=58253 RepID=A0A2M4B2H4_9DIPT
MRSRTKKWWSFVESLWFVVVAVANRGRSGSVFRVPGSGIPLVNRWPRARWAVLKSRSSGGRRRVNEGLRRAFTAAACPPLPGQPQTPPHCLIHNHFSTALFHRHPLHRPENRGRKDRKRG